MMKPRIEFTPEIEPDFYEAFDKLGDLMNEYENVLGGMLLISLCAHAAGHLMAHHEDFGMSGDDVIKYGVNMMRAGFEKTKDHLDEEKDDQIGDPEGSA
jgi:hypothetical protein